jgi:hypothetical protein
VEEALVLAVCVKGCHRTYMDHTHRRRRLPVLSKEVGVDLNVMGLVELRVAVAEELAV